MLLLAMVNRLKRASISYPPPGLDFNHMDVAVLLGDDIQLSVAGTKVSGHDAEAVVSQPSSRKFLTCVSQRPVVLPAQAQLLSLYKLFDNKRPPMFTRGSLRPKGLDVFTRAIANVALESIPVNMSSHGAHGSIS